MEDISTLTTLNSPNFSEPLKIKKALSEKQIAELISYANEDEDVMKFTADKKRFPDRESFDKWIETNKPTLYVLTNNADDLLGIVWFHYLTAPEIEPKKDLSDYGITYAIRLYGEARGKGLSKEFSNISLDDYMNSQDYKENKDKGIWLGVARDNIPAIKSYEGQGYTVAGYSEKWDKNIMVLKM